MKSIRHGGGSGAVNAIVLILLSLSGVAGCALPAEKSEPVLFEPSQDRRTLAGYYRDEAATLREKAAMIAESAVRYERLFGPRSDWVSGAQQLSHYYAVAAQDLERRAEAYDQAAGMKGQQGR